MWLDELLDDLEREAVTPVTPQNSNAKVVASVASNNLPEATENVNRNKRVASVASQNSNVVGELQNDAKDGAADPELYRKVFAEEAKDLHEYFEERAGILEYEAGLPRPEAELEAARMMMTYAQNKRYSWRGLRVALEGCSELLARLPDADGPVDSLPLGVSRLAVLPGKRVVRQGVFTGDRQLPDKAGAEQTRLRGAQIPERAERES